MFISPTKIKPYYIFRGRTLNFETVNPLKGNMIFIPTDNYEALTKTIGSRLFRPTQLMSIFTPRRVKPVARSVVIINQKDYYSDVKAATNGRIKKGKTVLSGYAQQNLVFDIYNDYKLNKEAFMIRRKNPGVALQKDLTEYLEYLISTNSNDLDYPDCYMVVPLYSYIENFKKQVEVDLRSTDLTVLFLKSLVNG